uniref:Phosphomannomutase/phosphoglucomutase n=1 Tax=Desulfatirhabdium butyrativorans TaxID=340467 RepID=A0A7C4MQE5_9BACT
MNPQMFREYDIRGIAGKDMTEDDVYTLGRAIGTYLKRRGAVHISVGRDCRLSSDAYAGRIIDALAATGCRVTDIGVCPTPVLYFSIPHLKQEGGVMVTASHNPAEYNGFKICLGSDSVHGSDIQQIRMLAESGDFVAGTGACVKTDIVPDYMDHVVSRISIRKPLRIGIDAGNGTAGVVALPLLQRLGMEVHPLYCEMDGTFPNHEADPTVLRNMEDLIDLVKRERLDVGIGFDGDGDRIGVVDETGRIVFGDRLMVLYAREILGRKPGATFISEVKCSQVLYDEIERLGGKAVMWKTGHSLIKKKMKETHAELAGEMSGHMFFADRYFGYDDAIYAACRLLEILSGTDKSLSELLSDLPQTCNTPEIRVECPDHLKFDVVQRFCDEFRKHYPVIDIDGARVLFEGGWGLVRASNTQPALVLRFEADSERRLAEIRDIVEGRLREAAG